MFVTNFMSNLTCLFTNGELCKRAPKRKIILLLVGLDNAGKTVAVKGLAGENLSDSVVPTIGFSVVNLTYLNYNVFIYDLGGGPGIRGIWHKYFVDAHGVIFVIDASDYERFDEVKIELKNLLSHEKICGKPLLILANKQDHQEALDEIDLIEKLDLENLVNVYRCPTLVESCSAKEITGNNKIDPAIDKGYKWLLNCVNNNYEILNKRVECDVLKQRQIDDEHRKQIIARINNKKQQDIETIENTSTTRTNNVNPFRPINKSDITLIQNEILNSSATSSPTFSVKSISSCINFDNKSNGISFIKTNERPKSAIQIVKKHLEKSGRRNSYLTITNNKTTPITLLSPKSAPLIKSKKPDNEFDVSFVDNFRSASRTGQILTVTELPNAIIDANGENIGDLFELNNFSSSKKLPPLRTRPPNDWIKTTKTSDHNVDEIYKDIS